MNHTDHVIKSEKLGKDMHVRVYGAAGYPVIAFPTQDQMADEWEANGMTEVFAPYVDRGEIQLFTVDSNDLESWSNPSSDFAARVARQEDYYDFVCDELVPFVHEANKSLLRPELTGASLGATQATICALRRPDLFQGVIGLSGMYHTSYFFGDWGNDVSYANDVNAFLPNTPADHPYIELYRHRTFAFAIGQAPDEQFGVDDLHFLQQTFDRLGISGWFDFWGPESNHDWYWWKQQMAKFLPEAVKELEGVAAAEPELAKPAVKRVTATKAEEARDKAKAKVASAKETAHAKAETTQKATKAQVKKVEQKAAVAAKKAEDDAREAKEKAEAAVARATEKAQERATEAKAQAKAETKTAGEKAQKAVAKAKEEAEAKAEATREKASAVKASTKAKAAATAKAASKKAAASRRSTATKSAKSAAKGTKAAAGKSAARKSGTGSRTTGTKKSAK